VTLMTLVTLLCRFSGQESLCAVFRCCTITPWSTAYTVLNAESTLSGYAAMILLRFVF